MHAPMLAAARSLVVAVVLPLGAAQAQGDALALLGTDVAAPAAASRPAPASETTIRHVRASRQLLPALADALRRGESRAFAIDLAPGLVLRARPAAVEATASGGIAMVADVLEDGGGTAVLVQNGAHLVGSVSFAQGAYLVETIDGTVDKVARLAPQLLPREKLPRASGAGGRRATTGAPPDPPADSGRLIDLMVVYTAAARTEAGGSGSAAIEGRIDLGVAETNAAYRNSGVAQRLRLVHRQEVAYAEAGDLRIDLDLLTGPTDGALDGVHALRDAHGADLVQLVVGGPDGCGIAWLLESLDVGAPALGFSVTLWTCISPNYTFGHELAHNMGLMHDPYTVAKYGEAPGPATFGYGRVDLVRRWRTVMAYNDQCADTLGTFCTRHLIFSNPRFAFDADGPLGQPPAVMGTAATSHNAHVLNRTAKLVAGYRATSALHPVPQRFADVPHAHPYHGHAEFLAQAEVTAGCAGAAFCPDAAVTRDQVAALLGRTKRAANFVPPAPTGRFADVPADGSNAFAPWIEQLAADGVTVGCSATHYCPDAPVTRGQLAALLLRASCGPSYVPAAPPTPSFADVTVSHPFYAYVEKLHALGVTAGCAEAPLRYCPDDPATRAHFAAFVERAFPFAAPSEVCAQ